MGPAGLEGGADGEACAAPGRVGEVEVLLLLCWRSSSARKLGMGIAMVWEVRHSTVVVVVEGGSSDWLVGGGSGWEGFAGDVEGGGGGGAWVEGREGIA